ncbi:MAG: hypothetical protein V1779_16510 [bacterium]
MILFSINHRTNAVVITFLLCVFIYCHTLAKEIHSTKEGGNWDDTTTWLGSVIPEKDDDVILNDTVVVTDIRYCDSLTIMPGALLEVKEKAELHTYTIKMINSDEKLSIIDCIGTITMEVVSPCDVPKNYKKLWDTTGVK